MEYIFIAENNISSANEDHEHEIKFSEGYEDTTEKSNLFIKDGKNFYVVFAGTPNITYLSDGSAEHVQELERIKNYIDSLTTTHIDYDETELGLKIYYYSNEMPENTWLTQSDEWQSDIVPHIIMQGQQDVLFSRFGTPEPGSYTFKYCRLVNNTIEYNTDSTKLVFVNGDEFTLNGEVADRDVCQIISGNVSITTTKTAFIAIIEDAI